MNNGEFSKASKELEKAKKDNPPTKRLELINTLQQNANYLNQKAYENKPWRLSANVGYMYDSNANVGTNASQILLFNLPFVLFVLWIKVKMYPILKQNLLKKNKSA